MTGRARRGVDQSPRRPAPSVTRQDTAFPIVGVGASSGGLEAFAELLRLIPRETGMAFVMIQHLAPTHASHLADFLRKVTSLPVEEATDGGEIAADHVYVTPSSSDVSVANGVFVLRPRPTSVASHLPIDAFFTSLSAHPEKPSIGVVLTGNGADGSEGLRAIKAAGGVTFAQDPSSAKFNAMPEAAVRAGVVDFVLPIPALAEQLLKTGSYLRAHAGEQERRAEPEEDHELRQVFSLLRTAVGVDFSKYKLASVRRRLARRMAVLRVDTLADYVKLLRQQRNEARDLFEDILIHVTSFFRDPSFFSLLAERVLPDVLTHLPEQRAIRIWCPGCSTGEEVYSIAIVLLEFLAKNNASEVPFQIFGSDVAQSAIEKARAGLYPAVAVQGVSAERLSRFFTEEEGGYRINKSVREHCAFVRHDLTRDPPFSKLDVVSCRNVLIYFSSELQKHALATFHFALNDPGFLLLGSAENVSDGSELFTPIDKENKVFARTPGRSMLRFTPSRDLYLPSPPSPETAARAPSPLDVIRRAEGALLEEYAPPGVVVNERLEILQFRGRTGPYLEPAPGPPQNDLLKMTKSALVPDLRIAISQARKDKKPATRSGIRFDDAGGTRACTITVVPVPASEAQETAYAVLFEEESAPVDLAAAAPTAAMGAMAEQHLRAMEEELRTTKQFLEASLDEHQRTSEALMSANEELMSSNEELQSLNEELETAKEELQSTNEELSTLNDELQTRNGELASTNNDLVNVLASVDVAIVIVDGQRNIRRFTPRARTLLNLLPSDIGRPIDDIKPNFEVDRLDPKIADVIETLNSCEEQVQAKDGRWYRLQIRPYTTTDKRIDGAVLSMTDIDMLRRALGAAEWARDMATAVANASPTPNLVLDDAARVLFTNDSYRASYLDESDVVGRSIYEIMNGAWELPALRAALDSAVHRDGSLVAMPVERMIPGRGLRSFILSGHAVTPPAGSRMMVLTIEDVTASVRAENENVRLLAELAAAVDKADKDSRQKDIFLATLSHELRTPLTSLTLNAARLRQGGLREEQIQRIASSMERAVGAQARLIEDLLDVSRIVAGKLKMETLPVNFTELVGAAVEVLRTDAQAKEIEIEVRLDDSPLYISGDPGRLQQVVVNLFSNAIKFTPKHGRVVVAVGLFEGNCRLTVTDNGMGIAPESLPHVFERFFQADSEKTRAHGGLGLGLAIARYIVAEHRGAIALESPGTGKGSTVTVLFPVLAVPPTVHADSNPLQSRSRKGTISGSRVLLVEDDAESREALAAGLAEHGAVVRAFGSAATALEAFQDFRPHVLLSDIAMPEMDGFDLIRRIRALDGTVGANVLAIAFSALATDEDRRRALDAGFQSHLAKPVDIERLIATVVSLYDPARD